MATESLEARKRVSNARAQAEYRRRMREAGYTSRVIWVPKGVKFPSVWDGPPPEDGEEARLRAKKARSQVKKGGKT